MLVKLKNDRRPVMVETEVISYKQPGRVKDKSSLDKWIERGVEFVVKENGVYKAYPSKEKQSTTVVSEPVQVSNEEQSEEEEEFSYSDLFVGHWTKQVLNVKEYTDDVVELRQIINYAQKDDDISEGTIKRLREYLKELQE